MHVIERVAERVEVRADALERAQRALTRGWVDVVVFTANDLTIEWVSPSVYDLGGWHPDELIGRPALSLIHPGDAAAVIETVGGVVDQALVYDPLSGQPLDPARFTGTSLRFARKDGTWAMLESRGNSMVGVDGVDGLLFVLRDISDRVAIDDLLHAIATDAEAPAIVDLIERAMRAHLRGSEAAIVLRGDSASAPEGVAIGDVQLQSIVGGTMRTGQPAFLDFSTGPWRGLWLLPVLDNAGSVLATIAVWNAQPGRPSAWTAQVVERVVRLAAIALVQHREGERVRHAATSDPLTGLANRRDLDRRLDQLAREPERPPCTMFYIGLDNFKPINDRFGHTVGDSVLATVADRLRATARGTDVTARLGGDEFVVVCRGITNEDQATVVADRLCHELEAPINGGGTTVSVGASIGWVVIQPDDVMHDILSRADAEMYRVKAQRRSL